MNAEDIAHLQGWVGKTHTQREQLSPTTVAALAATLDCGWIIPDNGAPLPALCHWLYFLTHPASSELDEDGHERRGGFLPPVPLPRRMWAASEIEFYQAVHIGDQLERASRVDSVQFKQGRSGELCFVTVDHEIRRGTRLAIHERQQLVYREQSSSASTAASAAPDHVAQWTQTVGIDPVLLFRYSALTFNSHRIHYDRDYAMQHEGYDGLVLQAPLAATLMLDALMRARPTTQIAKFKFRALKPVFD
ncbi:MAG: MaoC family dehydratase N-terminal domain-containing protein, partial [Pseudomonadota bacterium]